MKGKISITFVEFLICLMLIVFCYSEKNKNTMNLEKVNKNSFISMMIEQDDGSYKENNEQQIVSKEYVFNPDKSGCENGGILTWNEEMAKVEASLLTSDKCYAYFNINKVAQDLSGNDFNGSLIGAKYAYDDENKMGIYFDGIDDYVDIVDLPATITWDDGFTVELEAKWLSFNTWSRIFDFGNGQYNDNIFIANGGATNNFNFDSRYGIEASRGNTTVSDSIVLNKRENYKVEVIKNVDSYTHNIYKDNTSVLSKTYNVTNYVRNVNRTENFLGKSNWSADAYFKGYIYSLKITDSNSNIILWYKFD